MIVVGFLICVAAGYFVQPAVLSAWLSARNGFCAERERMARQRVPAVLTAEWVAKVIHADTCVMQALENETCRYYPGLAQEIKRLKPMS